MNKILPFSMNLSPSFPKLFLGTTLSSVLIQGEFKSKKFKYKYEPKWVCKLNTFIIRNDDKIFCSYVKRSTDHM